MHATPKDLLSYGDGSSSACTCADVLLWSWKGLERPRKGGSCIVLNRARKGGRDGWILLIFDSSWDEEEEEEACCCLVASKEWEGECRATVVDEIEDAHGWWRPLFLSLQ